MSAISTRLGGAALVAAVGRRIALLGERLPTLRVLPGLRPGPPNLYGLVHTACPFPSLSFLSAQPRERRGWTRCVHWTRVIPSFSFYHNFIDLLITWFIP
jgi:hypothetical protein